MFSAHDHAMMARAVALAERGRAITTPNPFVGCVIEKGGRIVGEGFTQAGGRPHAEAVALAQAGASARGATAYVTLEPCSERPSMRGPACANLLAEAGVARVVAAIGDPNPHINGAGIARLKAAGMRVECGLMEAAVREQLRAFLARVTRQRPWVMLKVAATLDGKTALNNGVSQWITGAAARRDVHRLRSEACALLTGYGTVKADDPQLTVRDWPCRRQPLRVLVDSRLEVADGARILAGGGTLVATVDSGAESAKARMDALRQRGIEVLALPAESEKGKLDLAALMHALAGRGINQVMVETGAKLNASLIGAGVVDEIVAYLAPQLVGDAARGLFALPEITSLDQRIGLAIADTRRIGDDWRVTALLTPR
ncbi:MAG TPA: bifunctional diaminohydroxyphosphoribosylaminopyrimidine deaminase/5-amino-6-(5-phosphoribosylamino)uracil reductase RibD [Usitatibacteraceae bacterium]|nr:bifunctional diaminohydroxyphosphoribosylaminopyrimidine deaminase/5-amino-6-(5-phosphoribosylamino)uracil reductase RibD [Usitatibacteraceae bacterium]